jgi:Flp pilus assembly protein protease CpaA
MLISIIDINARIIPNTLVLFLLFFSLLFSIFGAEKQPFLLHLLGLVVITVLFCIPLLLTKAVGSGDIKYLAVMGFSLGYPDAIKAIMIFSVILLGWMVFLLVSKKGVLQTKLALGPFISLGFVAILLV